MAWKKATPAPKAVALALAVLRCSAMMRGMNWRARHAVRAGVSSDNAERGGSAILKIALASAGFAALAAAPSTGTLAVSSPNFAAGGAIPAAYTCQGKDLSPALVWGAPPAGTKSLALVAIDLDAPTGADRHPFVHWLVFNLPPSARGLPEGLPELPAGAAQGQNDFGRSGYGGPCPPSGRHRYVFRLNALDTRIEGTSRAFGDVARLMEGHVLGRGELAGTYEKGK